MGLLHRNQLMAAALLVCAIGCATGRIATPDMSQGWDVRRGQAVWFPDRQSDGIAGELIVATNSAGDFVIEFAKPPISIVEARRVGTAWAVEFGMGGRNHSGRGRMPERIAWLHLVPALQGAGGNWKLAKGADGWSLRHANTGERLEGFFNP